MSMFKSVMVALGLGPDEEYDDRYFYGDDPDAEAGYAAPDLDDDLSSVRPAPARAESDLRPAATSGVAAAPVASAPATYGTASGTVGAVRPIRSVPDDDGAGIVARPIGGDTGDRTVRPTPMQRSKPRSLSPQSFGDAKIIADEFKRSTPVVMNLVDAERDLARRLIDFSSGVCYALGGTMEKLASNVFLLVPKGVEVSSEDRRRIEERGFDR